MSRSKPSPWMSLSAVTFIAAGALLACGGADTGPPDPVAPPPPPKVSPDSWFNGTTAPVVRKPKVSYPVRRGESAPLSEILAGPSRAKRAPQPMPELRPPTNRNRKAGSATDIVDPVLQDGPVAAAAPAPTVSVDGIANADNAAVVGFQVWPPDVNGDVGPNHFVQWVNLSIAVFDKSGNPLTAPSPGNTPWAGFGGPCETHNDGDPIVLYDQLADRWVFSQFALFTPEGGHQCFAVSQTPDPLGPYYLYDYVLSPGGGINDYPKIGVWPDGYYISINEFSGGGGFLGAVAASVDRESMLMGLPAAMVRFDVRGSPGEDIFSLQPSHLEGLVPPPAGAPNYIVNSFDDEVWSASPDPTRDTYNLWAFHVDWTDPENLSTLTGPVELEAPEFDAELCQHSRSCIVQPNGFGLDALAVMTMYRLAYRNLGTHEALVLNHTTDVGGDRAGVRWSEIRNPTSMPELFQTGTYAPADGLSRWMGSAAMDGRGNIAVGFSVASSTTFPGLRYAARLADDPPGELSQGEAVIVDGSSSQNGIERWGDYFSMSVDETDDCTFWFTGEYSGAATPGDWRTRIASFQLPLCTATEIGYIEGLITDDNGDPLPGARVSTGVFSTVAAASGRYRLTVPAGTYELTASAFGYLAQSAPDIVVADDATVEVDFALEAAPMVDVEGWVYDGTDAGWPLYARVTFTATGAPAQTVFTDPDTGWYSISLPAGTDFTARVTAVHPGYTEETRPITPGPADVLAHFGLEVNTGTCEALGYAASADTFLDEDFDGGTPPAGWTVTSSTTGCTGVDGWTGTDPGLRGNLTGGSGGFAIADSDQCGETVQMSTTLTSPVLDLSSLGPNDGLEIAFNQDLFTLPGTSARVEIWDGSTWVLVSEQLSDSRGPVRVELGTAAANGRSDARIRFVYEAGWDWWWQIDDLTVARTSCDHRIGGLIWGRITDRNTQLAVNGASVTSPTEAAVTTFATPDDPELPDGIYLAFMPAPGRLAASAPRYRDVTRMVVPQINGVRRVNLSLRAGRVQIAPDRVTVRVPINGTATATLTVTNDGTAPATVELAEMLGPPSSRPQGPFAAPGRRVGPKRMLDREASGVRTTSPPPSARRLAAGELVRRVPTGLVHPWGVGWDVASTSSWIGDIAAAGGDDHLHRFLADGTRTGETIDVSSYGNVFGADLAYDARSGNLWQLNVGGDNCIHEVDPRTRTVTGETICPAFGTTERGLAYDPVSDTFYAGSWVDARIVQFDRAGVILRTVQTGINIAGLAYNPATGHLFVQANDAAVNPDIYVLDADLVIIGQIELTDGGVPVFGDFDHAALELDCSGNLLAIDQTAKVMYVADSGEPAGCRTDVAWLSTAPASVTVPANATRTITVRVDAAGLPPGLYQATLLPLTDTPYDVPAIGVDVTVAFLDVPAGSYGDAEIHGLAGAGITYGCGAGNFCPLALMDRRVYAVWGLRSALGASYVPPRAFGLMFADVAPDSFGADFIEDGAAQGYFEGCGEGTFCPDAVVTRRQAAVTVLKLLEGPTYVPPPATGQFSDVGPAAAPYVEETVRRGIMEPCSATAFCPGGTTNRADHAIWLVRAFGFRTFPAP